MSRRLASVFAFLLVLSGSLPGQSRIPPRAVVNAASFARPGLPQGAIARGSIFSVFGQNIGPSGFATVSEFPLETSLDGVSISVTQGDVTVAAIPVFAAAGQINAILPSDAPLGKASLRVTNGVRRLNPVPVEIVESQLGVFTANGTGFGPGIAQNFESQAVQPINAPSEPAARGQVITIWATGLGGVSFPDNEAPVPGNLDVDLRVWIGGVPVDPADLLYFGRSPCCAGVDQIIVRVPQDAPLGCYVPLELQVGDGPPANTVTLAIADDSAACAASPAGPSQAGAVNRGLVLLGQVRMLDTVDRPSPNEYSLELGAARFRGAPAEMFPYDRLSATPPPGACLSYNFAGGFDRFQGGGSGSALDAGDDIRSTGPRGTARWTRSLLPSWDYYKLLGGETSALGFLRFLASSYLLPGTYQLSAGGGGDLPAFSVEAEVPAELEWTNRDAVGIISRSSDLEVSWASPSPAASSVLVVGGAYDQPTDSSYLFVCAAEPSENRFVVPARTLSGAPASRPEPRQSSGFLFVGALAGGQPLSIEGLDEAILHAATGQAKTVLWE